MGMNEAASAVHGQVELIFRHLHEQDIARPTFIRDQVEMPCKLNYELRKMRSSQTIVMPRGARRYVARGHHHTRTVQPMGFQPALRSKAGPHEPTRPFDDRGLHGYRPG